MAIEKAGIVSGMRVPTAAALLLGAVTLLAGCKSAQDKAIDQAKTDAVSTGRAEEVIAVDGSGNTTVAMVQPPAAAGQLPVVTTSTVAAGTPVTSMPDWSNGSHPAPGHVARYVAPGVPVAADGTASAPAAVAPAGTAVQPAGVTVPQAPGTVAGTAATGGIAPGNTANTSPAASSQPMAFLPTDVTLPAGTGLAIRVNQHISVKQNRAGDRFSGELAEDVVRDNRTVLPRGTRVHGVVAESHRRGHFKGRSVLGLRLTSLEVNGREYPLETSSFVRTKKGKGKRTAAFIGGGSGVGMLVGGIASGGVGLLAGGLAGGGLGTALAGATGNRDIDIAAESLVRFRLEEDLTVQPAQ